MFLSVADGLREVFESAGINSGPALEDVRMADLRANRRLTKRLRTQDKPLGLFITCKISRPDLSYRDGYSINDI